MIYWPASLMALDSFFLLIRLHQRIHFNVLGLGNQIVSAQEKVMKS